MLNLIIIHFTDIGKAGSGKSGLNTHKVLFLLPESDKSVDQIHI